MNKPPVPAEQNPKGHHERPGEPPANHEVSSQEIGRGGGEARNQELEEQSEEQVAQPGG